MHTQYCSYSPPFPLTHAYIGPALGTRSLALRSRIVTTAGPYRRYTHSNATADHACTIKYYNLRWTSTSRSAENPHLVPVLSSVHVLQTLHAAHVRGSGYNNNIVCSVRCSSADLFTLLQYLRQYLYIHTLGMIIIAWTRVQSVYGPRWRCRFAAIEWRQHNV
jgi:hypothetical protein